MAILIGVRLRMNAISKGILLDLLDLCLVNSSELAIAIKISKLVF